MQRSDTVPSRRVTLPKSCRKATVHLFGFMPNTSADKLYIQRKSWQPQGWLAQLLGDIDLKVQPPSSSLPPAVAGPARVKLNIVILAPEHTGRVAAHGTAQTGEYLGVGKGLLGLGGVTDGLHALHLREGIPKELNNLAASSLASSSAASLADLWVSLSAVMFSSSFCTVLSSAAEL
ncbi:MAG: hypothetical protein FRX49_13248, partial [Trebouxia sp. A1-2]